VNVKTNIDSNRCYYEGMFLINFFPGLVLHNSSVVKKLVQRGNIFCKVFMHVHTQIHSALCTFYKVKNITKYEKIILQYDCFQICSAEIVLLGKKKIRDKTFFFQNEKIYFEQWKPTSGSPFHLNFYKCSGTHGIKPSLKNEMVNTNAKSF
jgi:hypothetical protein